MFEKAGSHRSHSFKSGIDCHKNRRIRHDSTLQIRKSRRAEGVARRRAISVETNMAVEANMNTYTVGVGIGIDIGIGDASSTNEKVSLPPFLSLHNIVLPQAVAHLLTKTDMKSMDHWGDDTNRINGDNPTDIRSLVVGCGIVPMLVSNLKSSTSGNEVNGQSAICLGNIAGESPSLRAYLLECDSIPALLESLTREVFQNVSVDNMNMVDINDESHAEKIIWSIANLCRGRPAPILEQVLNATPHLCHFLESNNADIQLNACWALAYLTDESQKEVLQVLEDAGILRLVASFLKVEGRPSLVLGALRILCNFSYGNWRYIEIIFNSNILEDISRLLRVMGGKDVRIEACFLLSSIIAEGGNLSRVDGYMKAMVQSQNLVQLLLELIRDAHMDLKVEALWVIGNISEVASDKDLHILIKMGIIPALCHMNMEFLENKTIIMILDTFGHILSLGDESKAILHECGGVEVIEDLQTHQSDEVYRAASYLIDEHFGGDDSDEDYDLE